jgi:hypothetical protein
MATRHKSVMSAAPLGALLIGLCAVSSAFAQGTLPQSNYPQYPQPSTYPPTYAAPSAPNGAAQPMRSLFAASLAQMAQATGQGAALAVADGLTGALRDWFDRRRVRKAGYAGGGQVPQPQYGGGYNPSTMSQPATTDSNYQNQNPNPNPNGGYGTLPAAADPNMPQGTYQGAYQDPNTPQTGPNVPDYSLPSQGSYDPNYSPAIPQSSQQASGQYAGAQPAGAAQLYAGIAYEIHLLGPGGASTPVDPVSYSFRSGDQFRVYYRPALPGQVDVYNVNAAGQNTHIDAVNVAAGELASLGPYEFSDMTGEETLILRLTACVTSSSMNVTRNIVKAHGTSNMGSSAASPQIAACSDVITRGLKPTTVRDIRKATVEGGTSFALDAISPAEMSSGRYEPRQVTITLHHR